MIALIDGDVLAHHCCKSRFKTKTANAEITKVVINRHEHKFTKEEDRAYLEKSFDIFKTELEEVLDETFATDFLIAVKSDVNYRDEIYPMIWADGVDKEITKPLWGYKANRWKPKNESNLFVPSIRTLAIMEGLAIEAYGREADDLLKIWATQARAANEDYVVCTVDKDLKCIPGLHYHLKEKKLTKVTQTEALQFVYQQLLSGDPTDNIPGVPGLGPVKAAKYVAGISEEEELQELIVEQYMTAYEDNWYEMLLSNGKLLHLQSNINDHFTCSNWPVVSAFASSIKKHNHEKRHGVLVELRGDSIVPVAAAPKMAQSPTLAPLAAPRLGVPIPPQSPAAAPRLGTSPSKLGNAPLPTIVNKPATRLKAPPLMKKG